MVTLPKDVHSVDPPSLSKLTNGIVSTCDLAIQGRLETFSRQEVLRDFPKGMLGVLSEIPKLGVTTSASLQHLEKGRPVHEKACASTAIACLEHSQNEKACTLHYKHVLENSRDENVCVLTTSACLKHSRSEKVVCSPQAPA